jgi:hypothetical protein
MYIMSLLFLLNQDRQRVVDPGAWARSPMRRLAIMPGTRANTALL